MSCHRIPGITRIEYTRAAELPSRLMELSLSRGHRVGLQVATERIEYSGKATLSWEGTMGNGQRAEKSTLEFTTIHRLPEGERLAFIVTAASGEQYLIGTREGRYPVVEYTDTAGESGKTASARRYKITHTGRRSAIECVAWSFKEEM